MPEYLQRKYTDLIRHVSSKWVNWDPPIPLEVGAYGKIESSTGELRVYGSIYDRDIQEALHQLGSPIRLDNFPPLDAIDEDDYIVSSKGAKRVDMHLTPELDIAGLATVSFKGQWQFETGKRDALLVMHRPRLRYLPKNVILDALYEVPKLKDKYIVTSAHLCPAYSMYLSNKSGEKVTLALVAQVPIAGAAGVTANANANVGWWSDSQADLFRKASDKAGKYCFTPLYTLKCRLSFMNRVFRASEDDDDEPPPPLPQGDDKWGDVTPPWDPLNEDGEEDKFAVQEDEDPDEF